MFFAIIALVRALENYIIQDSSMESKPEHCAVSGNQCYNAVDDFCPQKT